MGRKRSKTISEYTQLAVPRNILLAASDFDYFDLSVIMALVDNIQPYMAVASNDVLSRNLDEITLSYTEITPRNEARESVFERLMLLSRKEIRYRVQIPGNPIEACTGLFERVIREEKGGCVYVRLQKEAIPWFLAIGQGYSWVEKQIFEACNSLYIRRTYLYLCLCQYRKSATITEPIDEWRRAIGCPESDTPNIIVRRYILPLQTLINNPEYQSHYQMHIEPIYEKTTKGVGRKSISSIGVTFCLKPEFAETRTDYGRILNILSKYYEATGRKDLRSVAEVTEEIYNSAAVAEALINLNAHYTKKHQGNTAHVGNTVIKAMKDRFGIEMKKNANWETNK